MGGGGGCREVKKGSEEWSRGWAHGGSEGGQCGSSKNTY